MTVERDKAAGRRRERIELLEALSARLTLAGVPHMLKHHTPNLAPSDPAEDTIPAVIVAGEWCRVRVLYWDGVPCFVAWDAHTRFPTDDAGVDRLAAVLAAQWRDSRTYQPVGSCAADRQRDPPRRLVGADGGESVPGGGSS